MRVIRKSIDKSNTFYEPFYEPLLELISQFGEIRPGDDGKRRRGALISVGDNFKRGRWKFHRVELSTKFLRDSGLSD